MHSTSTLLLPTPPVSPKSNHRTTSGNAVRRRSKMHESLLNTITHTTEDIDQAKVPISPNVIDDSDISLISPSISHPSSPVVDGVRFGGVADIVGATLPISEPIAILDNKDEHHHHHHHHHHHRRKSSSGRASKAHSRRNSWFEEEPKQGFEKESIILPSHDAEEDVSSLRDESTTMVEVLSPSSTIDHARLPTSDVFSMFASAEAAAKYTRMLRRASWPMNGIIRNDTNAGSSDNNQMIHSVAPEASTTTATTSSKASKPIYIHTPAVSPRHFDKEEHTHDNVLHPPSNETATSLIGDMDHLNFGTNLVSVPKPPSSSSHPLINLLLLGDPTCGLHDALDSFVGIDRMVGISCKTRIVEMCEDEGSYRVRCWHTPGTIRTLLKFGTLLRRTEGILLIYDVTKRESFQAVVEWADALMTYYRQQQQQQQHRRERIRPILILGNLAHLKHHHTTTAASAKDATNVSDLRASSTSAPNSGRINDRRRTPVRRSSLSHVMADLRDPLQRRVVDTNDDANGVTPHRVITDTMSNELLQRLRTSLKDVPIDLIEFDAYLWRQRYEIFRKVIKMTNDANRRRDDESTHMQHEGRSDQTHGTNEETNDQHQ